MNRTRLSSWCAPAAAALLVLLAGPALAQTLALQPTGPDKAGFVDELGLRFLDEIVSGSLAEVGFGIDVRGFVEFDTSTIDDAASVQGLRLQVWLSNHDNPLNPALPLDIEIHQLLEPANASTFDLWNAIGGFGGGLTYLSDTIDRTGDDFCPDAFVMREYQLPPMAVSDFTAKLPEDYFSLGFASNIADDPLFDHIDYIGYSEVVNGINCNTTDLPGSRITLLVQLGDPGCEPRNHGYWHRYCLGQGVIDPGRNGQGNGPSPSPQHADLPAGLLASADAAMAPYGLSACQALDEGPFSDPLLAALRELATVRLNLAGDLLSLQCEVELHPVDNTPGLTVADAIELMELRIADGSDEALREARWIGEHVVNGEALVR